MQFQSLTLRFEVFKYDDFRFELDSGNFALRRDSKVVGERLDVDHQFLGDATLQIGLSFYVHEPGNEGEVNIDADGLVVALGEHRVVVEGNEVHLDEHLVSAGTVRVD